LNSQSVVVNQDFGGFSICLNISSARCRFWQIKFPPCPAKNHYRRTRGATAILAEPSRTSDFVGTRTFKFAGRVLRYTHTGIARGCRVSRWFKKKLRRGQEPCSKIQFPVGRNIVATRSARQYKFEPPLRPRAASKSTRMLP
jgi:hypothetical protein